MPEFRYQVHFIALITILTLISLLVGCGDDDTKSSVTPFCLAANDGTPGLVLWRSDGTQSSTFIIKDIYSGGGDGLLPF